MHNKRALGEFLDEASADATQNASAGASRTRFRKEFPKGSYFLC